MLREEDTLILMHENVEVLRWFRSINEVIVMTPEKLPFYLRNNPLHYFPVWLDTRHDVFKRDTMCSVCEAREIEPDYLAAITDSRSASVTDHFWVTWPHDSMTWESLQEALDTDDALISVALSGEVENRVYDGSCLTSVFTLKGALPKASKKGVLFKKGNGVYKEKLACAIGEYLGINVVKAAYNKEDDIACCSLFTSESISLVHMSELLKDCSWDSSTLHSMAYTAVQRLRQPEFVRELEQLYLLKYLTMDRDFHEENFGMIYRSDIFHICGVAPAYDFNAAFMPGDVTSYKYLWTLENLAYFGRRNPSIIQRLNGQYAKLIDSLEYLSNETKKCLLEHADYLTRKVKGRFD